MARANNKLRISESVFVIDKWHVNQVDSDSQTHYAYAVQKKNTKWAWIRAGKTSESMFQEQYDSLEETIDIYNAVFYGKDNESRKKN